MINFPESQIKPRSISTFPQVSSNFRSKVLEVNHKTCIRVISSSKILRICIGKKLLFVFNLQISSEKVSSQQFSDPSLVLQSSKSLKREKFQNLPLPFFPHCRRLTLANFLSPPIYESGEKTTGEEEIGSILGRKCWQKKNIGEKIGLVFISSSFVGKYFQEVSDSKLGHLESVERHFSVCMWRNFIKSYSLFIITIPPFEVR